MSKERHTDCKGAGHAGCGLCDVCRPADLSADVESMAREVLAQTVERSKGLYSDPARCAQHIREGAGVRLWPHSAIAAMDTFFRLNSVVDRGEGRFRRMVERIAEWTDAEVAAVSPAQVRHVAQVVLAGADPTYPPFAVPTRKHEVADERGAI
jgi:hypothetical protein